MSEPAAAREPIRIRRPTFALARLLSLRGFGLCYFFAFASLLPQARGLFGANGIVPISRMLLAARAAQGQLLLMRPSLFWLAPQDSVLVGAAAVGALLGLLLTLGFFERFAAIGCWLLYLSFVNADFLFLQYQWDELLLESGFLVIFLARRAPAPPNVLVLLFRWLLFRLMFCSGVVKLASGDVSWRSLRALSYHYLSQPLPTPPAYYFSKLPIEFHEFTTAFVFCVELLLPFCFFLNRSSRNLAGALTIALQLGIMLTGNYAYFNLLTIVLCLFLFDDAALARLVPRRFAGRLTDGEPAVPSRILGAFYGVLLLLGFIEVSAALVGYRRMPRSALEAVTFVSPLHIVGSYGLFAVMTTDRHEIVVEGSQDGKSWLAYAFRYKPDDLSEAPAIVAPHQPRLDWQMWFASLEPPQPWFRAFLKRLSEGSEDVTALLAENPFRDSPPRYLRALYYDYEFTSMEDKKITGRWWKRKLLGYYFAPTDFGNK